MVTDKTIKKCYLNPKKMKNTLFAFTQNCLLLLKIVCFYSKLCSSVFTLFYKKQKQQKRKMKKKTTTKRNKSKRFYKTRKKKFEIITLTKKKNNKKD